MGAAYAQDYPNKPIRMLVPFAPGGAVDTTARVLAQAMQQRVNWQFVIENRPGGNGFIATTAVAKAAPDGYTLLMAHTGEFAVNPALFDNVPYELERDFVAITMVSDSPMLYLATAERAVQYLPGAGRAGEGQARRHQLRLGGQRQHQSPRRRVARAGRRHPAAARAVQGRRAGGGRGGGGRRALRRDGRAGRDAAHQVGPRQGDRHHHREEVAARSVVGDAARCRHSGPGRVDLGRPVRAERHAAGDVDRINKEVRETLALPDVQKRFIESAGGEAVGMTPAEFLARIKADAERYKRVVQKAGVKPG